MHLKMDPVPFENQCSVITCRFFTNLLGLYFSVSTKVWWAAEGLYKMGGDPSLSVMSSIHNYIFAVSETVNQIHFKLGGDIGLPWMGLYQICSNGHAPVNFGF